MQNRSCSTQKSLIYAGTGIDSVHPVMIAFYNRLKEKGKNGKVIVCAIMRKLVHIIFGILKSGKNMIQIIKQL